MTNYLIDINTKTFANDFINLMDLEANATHSDSKIQRVAMMNQYAVKFWILGE